RAQAGRLSALGARRYDHPADREQYAGVPTGHALTDLLRAARAGARGRARPLPERVARGGVRWRTKLTSSTACWPRIWRARQTTTPRARPDSMPPRRP